MNGLLLTLTSEGRIYLEENPELSVGEKWAELWEDITCNSPYEHVLPEEIGALTDSMIIGYDVPRDDNYKITEAGDSIYWYPEYMIFDEITELLNGSITLTKAQQFTL